MTNLYQIKYFLEHQGSSLRKEFNQGHIIDLNEVLACLERSNAHHGHTFELINSATQKANLKPATLQAWLPTQNHAHIFLHTTGRNYPEGYTGSKLSHELNLIVHKNLTVLSLLETLKLLEMTITAHKANQKSLQTLASLLQEDKISLYESSSKKSLRHKLCWLNHLLATNFSYNRGYRLHAQSVPHQTILTLCLAPDTSTTQLFNYSIAHYNRRPSNIKKLAPVLADVSRVLPTISDLSEQFLIGLYTIQSGLVELSETALGLAPYLAYNAKLTLEAYPLIKQ